MTLTPEQFNKLATKDDITQIKNEMVTKKEHNNVMTAIGAVIKKLDIIEHKFACVAFVVPLAVRQ